LTRRRIDARQGHEAFLAHYSGDELLVPKVQDQLSKAMAP
jgi:hypothetical protein